MILNKPFSYSSGANARVYSCRQYSIRFPDEFCLQEDAGHDFFAYLEESRIPGKPLITVKPGRTTPLQTFGMEIHSDQLLSAVIWLNAWKGAGGLLWMAGRSKYFVVKSKTQEYLCFYDIRNNTASYYVYMVLPEATKPLVITIHDLNMDDPEKEAEGCRIIQTLVRQLEVRQAPFRPLDSLLDRNYGGILTAKKVEAWIQLRTLHLEELEHLFYVEIQISQQRLRGMQKRGESTKDVADQWFVRNLKDYAERMGTLLEDTAKYLRSVYTDNRENEDFYHLASDMESFLQDHRTVSVSIDKEEKSETVRNGESIWAEWHYCSLLLKRQQMKQKLQELQAMDKELRNQLTEGIKQRESLQEAYQRAEEQLRLEKQKRHKQTMEMIQRVQMLIERKEADMGECYAQQKALKRQIENLTFFQRSQKEQLSRNLSQLIVRTDGIRSDIDNLMDQKELLTYQENDGLQPVIDIVNSYRLRIRLKDEELQKTKMIWERNYRNLLDKKAEVDALLEEFEEVKKLLKK